MPDVDLPRSTEPVSFRREGLHLTTAWVPPDTRPPNLDTDKWVFRSRKEESLRCCGNVRSIR